jgi:hypothetical protein
MLWTNCFSSAAVAASAALLLWLLLMVTLLAFDNVALWKDTTPNCVRQTAATTGQQNCQQTQPAASRHALGWLHALSPTESEMKNRPSSSLIIGPAAVKCLGAPQTAAAGRLGLKGTLELTEYMKHQTNPTPKTTRYPPSDVCGGAGERTRTKPQIRKAKASSTGRGGVPRLACCLLLMLLR